jgi:hypothetical protein
MSKWFEGVVDNFCEEQAIEEITSFDEIKHKSQDDFHKSFHYKNSL